MLGSPKEGRSKVIVPVLVQLCDQEQLADVVEHSLGCGPNFKYHYKNGKYVGAPHQYNCTYFSALGAKPQDYLLVRHPAPPPSPPHVAKKEKFITAALHPTIS